MTTAKYARRLIQRIYEHLRDQYGLLPGSVILDPFGGCGLGGIDAMLSGYHFIGIELEERFWQIGQQNIAYWRHRFGPQPGSVTLLQGDSRQLRRILKEGPVGGLVSSPPYANGCTQNGHDYHPERMVGTRTGYLQHDAKRYGETPGNLGSLPPGDIAAISSPPYAGAGEVLGAHNGIDYSKVQHGSRTRTPAREASGLGYGATEGQLAQLPTGDVTCISSPPYTSTDTKPTALGSGKGTRADGDGAGHNKGDYHYPDSPGQLATLPIGASVSSPPYCSNDQRGCPESKAALQAAMVRDGKGHGGTFGPSVGQSYGDSPGQLGNESQETFWSASSLIMAELAAILPPGALAVWICKAFVRQKAVVDFPGDWLRLCEHHGFTLVERIHASLVEHHGEEPTLWGETVQRSTKRSSFFRRLHEKRYPDLAIDHEVVLITRRDP